MNHLLIGITAGLGACAVLLAVLLGLVLRRPGRDAGEHVAQVVRALDARLDGLTGELAGAVAQAEDRGRRGRLLDELVSSIDLDEVLAATLDAALLVDGVDAALVRLESGSPSGTAGMGVPVVAALGLSAEDAERQIVSGPPADGFPDTPPPRAIEISYRYPDGSAQAQSIHSGVSIPLADDLGLLGYLTVFSHAPGHRLGEDELWRLEDLARRATPAIDNARRFREARRLADFDALTGLHNRRYFHDTLAREVARAQRYSRSLSLIVFDIDDFKDVNSRIGHLAADDVLAEASERVREVVRTADIACRVGGDEFAVILPESGLEQAEQLFARIQGAISGQPIGAAGRVNISAGLAELQPEDDSIACFERADQALYRAKENGKDRAESAQRRLA